MIIHLPWLNPKLSPNARVHWSVKAKHIRAERDLAHTFTLSIMSGWERDVAQAADTLPLKVTFNAPDNRKRDKQNMPASGTIKAYIDGIAEALGIDDNKFQPVFEYGNIIKGGRVIVEVVL
jgi:crossover junction endodeoxyribonuclease RusA